MSVAASLPNDPLQDVLGKLEKVKRGEHGWVARCPAHEDRNPSLSITVGSDDRVLLNCHAGCNIDAICHALGLEPKDLFPSNGKQPRREVARYTYTDELGAPLFDVVRFQPKDFRQCRPDGSWGLGQTRRVLYRLPRIVSAVGSGDPIYIVEGEKDVLAVEAAGAVATCPPMGAGKWREEYTESLDGARQIIVVADKDQPGLEHALQIERSLTGHAETVIVVEAAQGKDAADHLAAGLTLADLIPRIRPAGTDTIRVVSLDEFVSVTEDTAEPLIGDRDDSLLPANGMLLMYGDGGAGKTTLSIDAVAHLASGTDWLTNTVQRALRVLLIENEGPRGPFRELLGRKIGRWDGTSFTPNVHVLEEPWSRFTLKEPDYRRALADQIDRHEIDLVVVGPLASLGAKGTGTPDDINEFGEMTDDLRAQTERQFALWIVHHENKQGDVSGAWERVPDTLVHVSAQGNGRTRVAWRKVRWSSRLHNTSINLLWDEGGFTVDEARIRDLHLELVEAFENDDRWRTAREAAGLVGANQDKVREALINLVENQRMTFEIGPAGRKPNAKCWRLKSDSDLPSHHESPDLFGGGLEATDSPTPPTRGVGEVSQQHPHPPTDSDPPSQFTDDELDDQDRAFLARLQHEPEPDRDPNDDLPF